MGCFMAHAQSISIPTVNIVPGGEKSVDVTIAEGTKYTAFQFDVALPTGVSLKSATVKSKGATREITSGAVDGKYRVLSYDTKNEKLAETEVLSLTFAATDEFTTDAETAVDGIVIVDPEGNSATTTNGTVAVKVAQGHKITIPAGLKLAMVSDKDLDFTDMASKGLKAYICTGYETDTKTFWLTRVNEVPANTPILVKGETAGDYNVPVSTSSIYYPQNYLFGDATATFDLDNSEGYVNYVVSKSTGDIGSTTLTSLAAGKAYFHVPSSVTSTVATSSQTFTMGKGKKLLCVSDYDLDFSEVEGVKAYVATGFDFDRTIWLSRVMKVSAGTPIILRGEKSEGSYTVPSVASKLAYVNMFNGNTSSEAVTLTSEMNGSTIYVMSKSTGIFGTIDGSLSMSKGKAWLSVPSSFIAKIPAKSRGIGMGITELESEVISIKAIGGEDDGTTGISRVASEVDNDVWYNLKGQRIDTPTRKGLYIKNGKKVVVK
jgi:hypothetical protein